MSAGTEIGILVALVLANGLLAGAEIAVVAARRSRIEELIERGNRAVHLLAGDRIPRTGEVFLAPDGTELEVLDASSRRVRRVAVRPPRPQASDPAMPRLRP